MQSTDATPAVGGRMTDGEARFYAMLDRAVNDVLAGTVPFAEFVRRLWFDFRVLRMHGFDVDDAFRSGASFALASSASPDCPVAPITPLAEEFLKDIQGLTRFASRNGVDFTTVLSILADDINNIYFAGSDLSRLEAECFRPKVRGWAKKNLEPVGASSE